MTPLVRLSFEDDYASLLCADTGHRVEVWFLIPSLKGLPEETEDIPLVLFGMDEEGEPLEDVT